MAQISSTAKADDLVHTPIHVDDSNTRAERLTRSPAERVLADYQLCCEILDHLTTKKQLETCCLNNDVFETFVTILYRSFTDWNMAVQSRTEISRDRLMIYYRAVRHFRTRATLDGWSRWQDIVSSFPGIEEAIFGDSRDGIKIIFALDENNARQPVSYLRFVTPDAGWAGPLSPSRISLLPLPSENTSTRYHLQLDLPVLCLPLSSILSLDSHSPYVRLPVAFLESLDCHLSDIAKIVQARQRGGLPPIPTIDISAQDYALASINNLVDVQPNDLSSLTLHPRSAMEDVTEGGYLMFHQLAEIHWEKLKGLRTLDLTVGVRYPPRDEDFPCIQLPQHGIESLNLREFSICLYLELSRTDTPLKRKSFCRDAASLLLLIGGMGCRYVIQTDGAAWNGAHDPSLRGAIEHDIKLLQMPISIPDREREASQPPL